MQLRNFQVHKEEGEKNRKAAEHDPHQGKPQFHRDVFPGFDW